VRWAFQHDVRVRASNDLFVTMFDNGAGPPAVERQSRAIKLVLDLKHMTTRQVAQHLHKPALSASFEGNFQQLPNGGDFVGWGQQPYFSEYDRHGRLVFDGHFVAATASYRVYRFPWSGTPTNLPAVAALTRGHRMTIYASWNGATTVASWRALGGPSATSLAPVYTVRRSGFETSIPIVAHRYVAVQALDGAGHVLAQSGTIRPK
jgi:Arylsulfotransferase (ASST)